MQAKTFPHQAFDTISVHGTFGVFFGNGQPQTWITQVIRGSQNGQLLVTGTMCFFEHAAEFSRL